MKAKQPKKFSKWLSRMNKLEPIKGLYQIATGVAKGAQG